MVASVSTKEAKAAAKEAKAAEKAARAKEKASRPGSEAKPKPTGRRGKSEETNAIINSSPREREVIHEARQAADTAPEAAERRRIAHEFRSTARLSVPHDQGYLQMPPGTLPGSEAVIDAALALTASMGHERLVEILKKPFAKEFMPKEAFALDSPYMKFALSEEVVGPVCAYLGTVPVLSKVDVWYTPYVDRPIRSSQMWHVDYEDVIQLKVFVHCSDVGLESGPLTIVNSQQSEVLVERLKYRLDMGRVTDENVIEILGPDGIRTLEAPRGAATYLDTSRCFHFGSRISEGAPPRQVAMFQYMTPYAFVYEKDYREEAPYRHLADGTSSRLAKLLLGAV